MTHKIKVLIVEDQAKWSTPLKQLYKERIQKIPAIPVIKVVNTSAEADAALSTDQFDLLSLDINLGESNPSAHWDDLLKIARNSCTAVIIVTGIAYEPEFANTNLTLNESAITIFGSRNKIKVFQKPEGNCTTAQIATTIESYKQQLPVAELAEFCDRTDIDFWQIFPKAVSASTYILIPASNAWAESDRFANIIRKMMMRIATIYGQGDVCEDWYELIMSQNRIARLKWLASICKVIGALIFSVVGIISYHSVPALGGLIGGFCGLVLGGCCGLVIYRRLIIEIGIKSIGHFGRNHT